MTADELVARVRDAEAEAKKLGLSEPHGRAASGLLIGCVLALHDRIETLEKDIRALLEEATK